MKYIFVTKISGYRGGEVRYLCIRSAKNTIEALKISDAISDDWRGKYDDRDEVCTYVYHYAENEDILIGGQLK